MISQPKFKNWIGRHVILNNGRKAYVLGAMPKEIALNSTYNKGIFLLGWIFGETPVTPMALQTWSAEGYGCFRQAVGHPNDPYSIAGLWPKKIKGYAVVNKNSKNVVYFNTLRSKALNHIEGFFDPKQFEIVTLVEEENDE